MRRRWRAAEHPCTNFVRLYASACINVRTLEALLVCQVEDNENTHRSTVVGSSDRTEALLAGRVPLAIVLENHTCLLYLQFVA